MYDLYKVLVKHKIELKFNYSELKGDFPDKVYDGANVYMILLPRDESGHAIFDKGRIALVAKQVDKKHVESDFSNISTTQILEQELESWELLVSNVILPDFSSIVYSSEIA